MRFPLHVHLRQLMERDATMSLALYTFQEKFQAVQNKVNAMELELTHGIGQEGQNTEDGNCDKDGDGEEDRPEDGDSNMDEEKNENDDSENNLDDDNGYFTDDGGDPRDERTAEGKGKGRADRGVGAASGPKPGSRQGQTCKHCNPPATAK